MVPRLRRPRVVARRVGVADEELDALALRLALLLRLSLRLSLLQQRVEALVVDGDVLSIFAIHKCEDDVGPTNTILRHSLQTY